MISKAPCILLLMVSLQLAAQQGSGGWQTADDISEGARGSIVGTIADVEEGAGRFQLTPDNASSAAVFVTTDSLTTTYGGFGTYINGQPEIFSGSKGFSNLRVGDRVNVRGTGSGPGRMNATGVELLGRTIPAGQVGVGDSRSPGQISVPTASGTTATVTDRPARLEGTVRQVNGDDDRLVIETDRREMLTIRGSRTTPVTYHGGSYRIRDLEPGDRIRVQVDATSGGAGDLTADAIEVLQSIQDRSQPRGAGSEVTTISGAVQSVDRSAQTVTLDNGRGRVEVDISAAVDESGNRVRPRDLKVGQQIDITGSYGTASDVFTASTIRTVNQTVIAGGSTPASGARPRGDIPASITIYGRVTESLRDSAQLVVRDRDSGKTYRIYVLEDFVARSRANGYMTAERIPVGDSVVIKAYRTPDGDLIAQTIRER